MTYTLDETLRASIEYFNGDDLAARVFVEKYALRDHENNLLELTPADMIERLTQEFSRIETGYPNPVSENEIRRMFASGEVWAQGSPMSAIGNSHQIQSLSNCFVIEPPHDSYGGILKTDQEQAQIMKRRGGVGFDISSIRPKGLSTSNAARTTDGIGVFMERFSNTCREVAQGGRRGALMLTISVHHPEIRTFIKIKHDLKKVTGANVSIRLTDEFMKNVEAQEQVMLRFPVEPDVEHSVVEHVDAAALWEEIVESAWKTAEPGLLFWDNVIKRGPADAYEEFRSVSTNPCAEITLSPYDSCRLMLINLTKFVDAPFTANASFNFKRFSYVAGNAQRLMDGLVDLELEAVKRIIDKIDKDPEPIDVKRIELELWKKISLAAKNGRRTGLGITGLGDTIAMLNIRYGTDESIACTENIYKALALSAYRSSVKLAEERGAFPTFSHDVERGHEFIEQILNEDDELRIAYNKYGRRNIACTTTAPAGSVSMLAQTTSGCEPVFELSYVRNVKAHGDATEYDSIDDLGDKWIEHKVVHHGFKHWMDVSGLTEVEDSPYFRATSSDINWIGKIKAQAAAQKWICHSISNTTNIPEDTPLSVAKQIYHEAWKAGCKGVTIYRAGSRTGVLVADSDSQSAQPSMVHDIHAPKRPHLLKCDIHRTSVKGEQYLVIVGLLGDRPYEIFCGLSEHIEIPKKSKQGTLIKNGKQNGIATYNLKIPVAEDDEIVLKNIVEQFDNPTHGAFTRSLSLALRHGVPVQYIVEQLRKDRHSDVTSFAAAIARILSKNYIADGTNASSAEKTCDQCASNKLAYQSGCVTCMNCGNSKCM